MSDPRSFGGWIKRRRRALGITQKELAQQVGCAVITLQKIEAETLRPSVQLAQLLADLLAASPEDWTMFLRLARPEWRRSPHNLPVPLTDLIGREQDVATICALLMRPDTRLLTLTGAPGSGKTRLGVQAATELCTAFAGGACFVGLAALNDAGLVAAAIAHVLGIPPVGRSTAAAQLTAYLRDRNLLLLLDNFEQVMAAAPLLGTLLAAAPQLKLLVTSRSVLRIAGEHKFFVSPLALPDLVHLPPVEMLATNPAVALFVARTQAVRPDFALTSENATAIAEICIRLDGLPLAIELAAARSKVLSPQAMLNRLTPDYTNGSPLELLTRGPRDLPVRQQTLRNAITWSYDLLPPDEQALFARLGVFTGGCTLEAAEAVAGALSNMSGLRTAAPPPFSLLPLLESLCNKSLLSQEEKAGERRFTTLGTIREYALERLALSGAAALVRQRQALFFLNLVETAESKLRGPQQRHWFDRLDAEWDNLCTVLSWSLETQALFPETEQNGQIFDGAPYPASPLELGLRLVGAFWWFCWMRGYVHEGRAWVANLLAQPATAVPPTVRARAFKGAGWLAYFQGDDAACSLHEESLMLGRAAAHTPSIAAALFGLGVSLSAQGDYEQAIALLGEALALKQNRPGRTDSAWILGHLANVAWNQGNYDQAATWATESLNLFRSLGDSTGIGWPLRLLALVAYVQGDSARARYLFAESLITYRSLDDQGGIADCLTDLAGIVHSQGQSAQAAHMLGAVDALRETATLPISGIMRARYEQTIAAVRSSLDATTFASATRVGRTTPLETIIEQELSSLVGKLKPET